jgi:cellulose biosynthesis protein BcsQ
MRFILMSAKVITVTDDAQNQGKTTLVYGLAYITGKLGKRVAVIDADQINMVDKISQYCGKRSRIIRHFDCLTLDQITRETLETYDIIYVDCSRDASAELKEKLGKISYAALMPVTLDPKAFNEGIKPALAAMNGCRKGFIINQLIDGSSDRLKVQADALGIPIVAYMPRLISADVIVKAGSVPDVFDDADEGAQQFESVFLDISKRVTAWLA